MKGTIFLVQRLEYGCYLTDTFFFTRDSAEIYIDTKKIVNPPINHWIKELTEGEQLPL